MNSQNDMLDDFQSIIDLLNKGNNLSVLEKTVEIYLAGNSGYLASQYVSFQMSLYGIFENETGKIIHFLKMPNDIPYNGNKREVYRRFINLKKIASNHLRTIEDVLTSPDKLKGNLFSFNNKRPHEILGTLIKNDGEDFSFSMEFTDGMSLAATILENLNEKLNQGVNNIDTNTFDMLTIQYNQLSNSISAISAKEEESSRTEN